MPTIPETAEEDLEGANLQQKPAMSFEGAILQQKPASFEVSSDEMEEAANDEEMVKKEMLLEEEDKKVEEGSGEAATAGKYLFQDQDSFF